MAFTVILHISNADPILADMEEMPDPQASYVLCTNARARDGKTLHYVDPEATRLMFPWHRISFIETLPGEEDRAEFETFFRD